MYGLPGFIDKSASVSKKGTVNGVEDGKFSKRLHGEQQHGSGNHEADQLDGCRQPQPRKSVGHLSELTTLPGPPLSKAPPEPTKRPAPMEPPGFSCNQHICTGRIDCSRAKEDESVYQWLSSACGGL